MNKRIALRVGECQRIAKTLLRLKELERHLLRRAESEGNIRLEERVFCVFGLLRLLHVSHRQLRLMGHRGMQRTQNQKLTLQIFLQVISQTVEVGLSVFLQMGIQQQPDLSQAEAGILPNDSLRQSVQPAAENDEFPAFQRIRRESRNQSCSGFMVRNRKGMRYGFSEETVFLQPAM